MIIVLLSQLAFAQECPKIKINKIAKIQSEQLDEVSGMVISDSMIWVHNDSGDSASIYAISKEGVYLGKADIKQAYARDWEEMSSFEIEIEQPQTDTPGPPAKKRFLLIGDIGDNHERKESLELYVIPEPSKPEDIDLSYSFTIQYDQIGPKDAEAMFVDPTSNELIIYTKGREGTTYWLKAPLPTEKTTIKMSVFHQKQNYDVPPTTRRQMAKLITSADISPDGRWIVTRDYLTAKMYYHPEGQDIATTVTQTPCHIPLPLQEQGETIAFAPDGKSLWTLSEGQKPILYQIELHFPKSSESN
jgi:hypothetical protein